MLQKEIYVGINNDMNLLHGETSDNGKSPVLLIHGRLNRKGVWIMRNKRLYVNNI